MSVTAAKPFTTDSDRDSPPVINGKKIINMDAELFSIIAPLFALKNPRTGKKIEFRLGPHEHKYLYYQTRGNDAQYCYTPHKDIDGWYYSFAYIPQGKGARTGNATRWTMKKLRPHRTRKAARSRALKMLDQSKPRPRTKGPQE